MHRRINKIFAVVTLALTLIATQAWALSKDEAKAQGLVGEAYNGYLAIVTSNPTPELRRLVAYINKQRKAAYANSARSAGVERSVFELRMGQRLKDRASSGHYIQLKNGNWKRK